MGRADYLRHGDYNAICDRCGFKFKFSELRKEWDGLYVCTAHGCWEPRQPQDYLKGIKDNMSVPISRPEAGTEFLQDETVTEQPIISLSLLIKTSINFFTNVASTVSLEFHKVYTYYQNLTIAVSSLVSIVKNLYPFTGNNKVIDGSAINKTTLG